VEKIAMFADLEVSSIATRELAMQVAKILHEHPKVFEVYLFGSVAREGVGLDLDLFIISDSYTAGAFLQYAREALAEFEYIRDHFAGIYGVGSHVFRAAAATEAIGQGFGTTLYKAETLAGNCRIDLFVFPPNWRARLDYLQSSLPHKDPNFMHNISNDAFRVA
jgi:predicted nucleotidyltransferase